MGTFAAIQLRLVDGSMAARYQPRIARYPSQMEI
jgi:hypothetical protein